MTQLLGVFLTKPVSVTPYLLEKWTKKLQDCYLQRFKIIQFFIGLLLSAVLSCLQKS